jgi:hypothetical protein
MSAEEIARTLGGRKTGRGWMARCPAHDDQQSASPKCVDHLRLLAAGVAAHQHLAFGGIPNGEARIMKACVTAQRLAADFQTDRAHGTIEPQRLSPALSNRGARTTVVLRRAWQQDRQRTVDLGRDRQDFETRFISRIAFEGSH